MSYIPERGDIIKLDFSPTKGHEQQGYRPALVVSNGQYNKMTGLALVCPITNTLKDYPTHIFLEGIEGIKTTGVILVEQARMIDYRAREVRFIETAPEEIIEEAVTIIGLAIQEETEEE